MALLVLVTVLIVYADRDGYHDNADGSVVPRRALLRDGHPLHDRLRRHRPVQRRRPADQHLPGHAAAGALPDHPGRHDPRGAHRAHPGGVAPEPLEAHLARSHRRRRVRHQGPVGRPDRCAHRAAARSRSWSSTPAPRRRRGRRAEGYVGVDRRRHAQRRAAAGRGAAGAADHHRHPARRHGGPGDADGPAAQPRAPRSSPRSARRRTRRCCGSPAPTRSSPAASAAGRLLGLSVLSPSAGQVMEDLIQQGSGLDLVERPVIKAEVGKGPREIGRPGGERRARAPGARLRRSGRRDAGADGPADHDRAGDAGRAGGARRPSVRDNDAPLIPGCPSPPGYLRL